MRPTGVTILAVLCFIGAAMLVLIGLGMFVGMGALGAAMESGQGGSMAMLAGLGAAAGVVMLVFAAIYGFVGFGLWTLRTGPASCAWCWPSSEHFST